MDSMLSFCVELLSAIADFLNTEPIFYLFGVLLFVVVCKALRMLTSW